MKISSPLLLALTLLAVACGDAGSPPPPGDFNGSPVPGDAGATPDPEIPGSPSAPDGWRKVDLYADSELKLNPGECRNEQDCDTGESCQHDAFFRDRSITLGVCLPRPSIEYMGLLSVSPVRFTDEGGTRDPASDDFVVEPGVFDITFMVDQDGWTTSLDLPGFALPIEPQVGFGFVWQLGMHIGVVDPNDPDHDIECNVGFFRSGDVTGGVIRAPGKVLCSTHNWQSPQAPSAPGLLIEYEQCAWSDPPNCQ